MVGTQEADARLRDGKPMFLAGLMYGSATADETGNRNDGWGIGAAFEQVTWNLSWAFGVNFAYASFREELSGGDVLNFSTFPVTLMGKYYFLDGNWHPFVGVGFGIHLSKQTWTQSGGTREISDSGFNVSVPVGLMWEMRDNLGLSLSYIGNYTDAKFFQEDMVHVVQLGLVFR